jgi:hypothetical protein
MFYHHIYMAVDPPEPEVLELIAFFESLAAAGASGFLKALPSALSRALGVQQTMKLYGYPSFTTRLRFNVGIPKIVEGVWPTRSESGIVLLASEWALSKNLPKAITKAIMARNASKLLLRSIVGMADFSSRPAVKEFAKRILDLFWTDLEGLYEKAAKTKLQSVRGEEKKKLVKALTAWKDVVAPYTVTNLVALVGNLAPQAPSVAPLDALDIVRNMLHHLSPSAQARAPVAKQTATWSLISAAGAQLSPSEEQKEHLQIALLREMMEQDIRCIPWIADKKGKGRPSQVLRPIECLAELTYPKLPQEPEDVVDQGFPEDDGQQFGGYGSPPEMNLHDEEMTGALTIAMKLQRGAEPLPGRGKWAHKADKRKAIRQANRKKGWGDPLSSSSDDNRDDDDDDVVNEDKWNLFDITTGKGLVEAMDRDTPPSDVFVKSSPFWTQYEQNCNVVADVLITHHIFDWQNKLHRFFVCLAFLASVRCPDIIWDDTYWAPGGPGTSERHSWMHHVAEQMIWNNICYESMRIPSQMLASLSHGDNKARQELEEAIRVYNKKGQFYSKFNKKKGDFHLFDIIVDG